MKFIVSSSLLLKSLQSVFGVINTNNALEILNDFLLDITPGELTITGSDLETTISCKIAIEATEAASVAVHARTIVDALKAFPEQPLTFTINNEDYSLEISSDNGKYKLQGHNPEDFPKVQEASGASNVDLPSEVILNAINKTLFATGNDELRPVMSGVLCQLNSDNVTFVATDAHKLVRYRRRDSRSEQPTSLILPKKPLNLLKNILTGSEGRVQIDFNEQNAFFIHDNYRLSCRLIEGKYPNYDAVIPADNPNRLTLDRSGFLSAIRRVSVFSSKSTYQVRLKVTGSELLISAEDIDYSTSAKERLTCQYAGSDIEIGFNSRFLIEMLSNVESEEIVVEMSAPNRAGIILPAVSNNENEDILMLVMPVMLAN